MLRLSTGVAVLALVVAVCSPPRRGGTAGRRRPGLAPWFESLKQPGTGVSCCSISDCRPVQYRLAPEGYEALVGSLWVHVPDDRILRNQKNPLGRAVLCRSPASGTIFCFVPGPET